MTWQDLHNDNARPDENEYDKITQTGEIEVNNYVFYEYKAEVELFRNVPCSAEVVEMKRLVCDYDHDGEIVHELELCVSEFPEYIKNAAEKKEVEGWV